MERESQPDGLIGQVIDGRYEIRARIGKGGMGAVYRAWQASVEREVAIKVIHAAFSRDAVAVRRFEREARLASKLSQPNTVSVLDFGRTPDQRLFLAMELIRGKTLYRVLVDAGVFSPERVARVGMQICDALEAAHALGIIHRDLKLDNVIVLDDPPGRDLIKVLDFGLAKLEGDQRGTQVGYIVGTPRYIAPEVARTGVAVAASDLYALGVMLVEIATGASPWRDENDFQQLAQKKLDPAPVIATVPPQLRALVAALLDPDPDKRPTAAGARDMLGAVAGERRGPTAPHDAPTMIGQPALRDEPDADVNTVPSAPKRRRKRWPWPVVLGALVAAAGLAFAIAYIVTQSLSSAPAMVRLHITTAPAGAKVRVIPARGHAIDAGPAPIDVDVPRGNGEIEVRAHLHGRKQTTMVVPDHDQDVTLTLPGD